MEIFKDKEKLIILILIILVPFLFGSLFFITPWFGDLNLIDEGQFAAWANHMLLGKHMFSDIYITYGPLYVYPLYLIFKFLGPQAFYVRLLYSTIGTILGMLFVWIFVEQFRFNKYLKYILLTLLILIPGNSIRQGVVFLSLLPLLKINPDKLSRWSFILGVLMTIAFLITPEAGIILGAIFILTFSYYFLKSKKIKVYFENLLLVVLGILFPFSLFYIWSSKEGWFNGYLATTKDILSSFSGVNLPNGMGFPNPLEFYYKNKLSLDWIKYLVSKDMLLYWQFLLFIIATIYVVIMVLTTNIKKNLFPFILILFYGLISYYSLIGRTGNFFLTLTPSLIILTYFAEKLFNIKDKVISKILLVIILLFIMRILFIFHPSISNINGIFHEFSNKPVERIGAIKISKQQLNYILAVRDYVSKNTNSKDKIFFLSNEPMMYMITNRLNPSRYDLPYIAHTRDKRYEMLSSFKTHPPKIIFYDTYSWAVDGISNKERLPEIMQFIRQNYYKTYILNGRVEVYTIKHD